jgi:hypothetical protein
LGNAFDDTLKLFLTEHLAHRNDDFPLPEKRTATMRPQHGLSINASLAYRMNATTALSCVSAKASIFSYSIRIPSHTAHGVAWLGNESAR